MLFFTSCFTQRYAKFPFIADFGLTSSRIHGYATFLLCLRGLLLVCFCFFSYNIFVIPPSAPLHIVSFRSSPLKGDSSFELFCQRCLQSPSIEGGVGEGLLFYLIKNEKRSTFFRAIPVPRATQCKGSSATWKGMLILSCNRLAKPRSKAPPPAR